MSEKEELQKLHEKRLEKFVAQHLYLIEDNISLISSQHILNDVRKRRIGVLDIYAASPSNIIIIEGKVVKLTSRDLGQCLGYLGYFKKREESGLPPARLYIVGPAVDPIFHYGALMVHDFVDLRTIIYSFPLGHSANEEEWTVNLSPYDPDNHLRIPL